MSPADDHAAVVAAALGTVYGIRLAAVTRIRSGTATANFHVRDHLGEQWFAKVYRDGADLSQELAALELSRFARDGGLPVPAVRPTLSGDLIARHGRLALSLWQYVDGAETAEGGLHGRRWTTVGLALGHLHRRLARHPSAAPAQHNGATVCDLTRARHRYEQLIAAYARAPHLGAFEQWALEAARERQSLLPRVAALLEGLPALTLQIVHGDLAAPNLLLRQTQVAAFIDFQPPVPRHLSWEIARIGCDPRTVVRGPDWLDGLVRLTAAYRQEHPTARAEDLIHTVTVGCAYTLASVYPLSEPVREPGAVDAALEAYGRARHTAALTLLDRLTDAEEALHAGLR